MKKTTTSFIVGFAVLACAATAVAKDKQTRPWISQSHVVVPIALSHWATGIFPWTLKETGTGTDVGNYTSEGSGSSDENNGSNLGDASSPQPMGISCSGTPTGSPES